MVIEEYMLNCQVFTKCFRMEGHVLRNKMFNVICIIALTINLKITS